MKEFWQSLRCEQLKLLPLEWWGVICGIITLYVLYLILKPKRVIVSKGKEGTVSLSQNSLKRIIESVAKDVGIHERICSKIKCCGGNIVINVSIRIGCKQNLLEVSKSLREALQDVLIENIGLTAIRKINITVSEFLTERNNSQCLCKKGPTEPGMSACDCRKYEDQESD
jgi:hypothetical protein